MHSPTAIGRGGALIGYLWAPLALIFVLVFFLHREFLVDRAADSSKFFVVASVMSVATVVSIGFAWVRYDQFGDVFTRLTRLSAAGLFVYLIVEPVDLTFVPGNNRQLFELVNYCYWPAILFALVGIFRPSMAYAPAV
ncbi:MAG: hypothetical protein AAGC92_03425 [Pseudomonadota bacterium]